MRIEDALDGDELALQVGATPAGGPAPLSIVDEELMRQDRRQAPSSRAIKRQSARAKGTRMQGVTLPETPSICTDRRNVSGSRWLARCRRIEQRDGRLIAGRGEGALIVSERCRRKAAACRDGPATAGK